MRSWRHNPFVPYAVPFSPATKFETNECTISYNHLSSFHHRHTHLLCFLIWKWHSLFNATKRHPGFGSGARQGAVTTTRWQTGLLESRAARSISSAHNSWHELKILKLIRRATTFSTDRNSDSSLLVHCRTGWNTTWAPLAYSELR